MKRRKPILTLEGVKDRKAKRLLEKILSEELLKDQEFQKQCKEIVRKITFGN